MPSRFTNMRIHLAYRHILVRIIFAFALGQLLINCSELNQDDPPEKTGVPVPTLAPPTPTPTVGTLRTDPVPYGHPLSYGDLEITVLDIFSWKGGELLFESVKREGHFTSEKRLYAPETKEGFEWLVIEVRVRNVGDPNQTSIFGPAHFKVVGKSESIYEIANVPAKRQREYFSFAERLERHLSKRYLDSGEFFGGSELTGHLIAQVAREDDDFVLIYSSRLQESGYLSLNRSTAGEAPQGVSGIAPSQIWPLPPVGTGRTNPVPYGSSFIHDGMEVTILESRRLAKEGRFFPGLSLEEARAGYHYIGIKLRLRNVSDRNETRTYSKDHFWIVGGLGFVYDEVHSAEGSELYLGRGEFFGGGEITGAIGVEIFSDDDQLVLIYAPPSSSDVSYYSVEPTQR